MCRSRRSPREGLPVPASADARVRQDCSGSGGLRIHPADPRDCWPGWASIPVASRLIKFARLRPTRLPKPPAKDQARRRNLTGHETKAKVPQTHAPFRQFQKNLGPFTPPKSIRLRTNSGRIQRTNGHLNGESSTYGSRDTPPLTFSVRFSLHHHHIATRPSLDRRHKSCREGPAPPANENGGQGLRCQEPIAQATGPRRIHKTALRELTTGGNPLFFYHRVKTHLLPHEWGPLSSLTGSGSPAGRGRISARQDPR